MNDAAFLEWTRHQPSCITGGFGEFVDSTSDTGLNDPGHVRRAGPAGTAYKPLYSAVPLRHEEHLLQSSKGERACLLHYLPDDQGRKELEGLSYVEQLLWAEAWFDEQRLLCLRAWLDTLPATPEDLPEGIFAPP